MEQPQPAIGAAAANQITRSLVAVAALFYVLILEISLKNDIRAFLGFPFTMLKSTAVIVVKKIKKT